VVKPLSRFRVILSKTIIALSIETSRFASAKPESEMILNGNIKKVEYQEKLINSEEGKTSTPDNQRQSVILS